MSLNRKQMLNYIDRARQFSLLWEGLPAAAQLKTILK